MCLSRRSALPIALGLLAAPASASSAPSEAASAAIPLWPGPPPGGGAGPAAPERIGRHGQITDVRLARLIPHRPARPNGAAVIVIAGGGYRHIEAGRESGPAARWLAGRGFTAFELIYRLPNEGWPPDASFADGARAVRLARALAHAYAFEPGKIGVMGFSAGAHLAGMTAVGARLGAYPPIDDTDRLSARPAFAALIYPVLTMMPPFNRTESFRQLLGAGASAAVCAAYSVERLVDGTTPPVFLAQAADDPVSPVENSTLMFASLLRAGLPPEMHVFQRGGHGWGMGVAGSEVAAWPALYARWAAPLLGSG